MITDFPINPGTNIGGLQNFHYCPYRYVLQIPPVVSGVINSLIVFLPGTKLFHGYCTLNELTFEEKSVPSENGQSYSWTINGFTPGDSPELSLLMQDMERDEHLVMVKDHAGIKRLVGYGSPLTFSAVLNDGKQPGDARGYAWTFTGTGLKRAPFYPLG